MTLLTAHWLACLWHLVTVIESDDAVTWVDVYYCSGSKPCAVSTTSRYILSLYFSSLTLTTIGYGVHRTSMLASVTYSCDIGDVVPNTDTERWASAFISLIGASVYAYIIGMASGIVSVISGSKLEFQETVDEMNQVILYTI